MGFISFLKSLWKKEVELVEETISEELIQPTKVEEPAYYQSEDPELVKTFTVPTEGISRVEAEKVLDTKIEESKSVEPEPVKEEPRQETAKEIKAKVTKSQVKKVAPSPKKPVAKKKPAPKKKP